MAAVGERLLILNEYGQGLLGRIAKLKADYAGQGRPKCLVEKSYDSAVKIALKKFPTIEIAKNDSNLLFRTREAVMEELAEGYFALLDVVNFRVATFDIMNQINNAMMHFDLTVNTALTVAYFSLIATYASVMILFCEFADRKAVVGLYQGTHDLIKGTGEPGFPQLGQLVGGLTDAIRHFPEEFAPFGKTLGAALGNLHEVFKRRYLDARTYRNENYLNLVANIAAMKQPSNDQFTNVNIISLLDLHKWITIGYLLVPAELNNEKALEVLKKALADGFLVQIYREHAFNIHNAYENVLTNCKEAKRLAKSKSSILDQATTAAESVAMHHERRTFLRQSMASMLSVIEDKPGLLGPKGPQVLAALSMGRDEVLWFFLHCNASDANKPKTKHKFNHDALVDRDFCELLFFITRLEGLVLKHTSLLHKYYASYLVDSDMKTLRSVIEPITFGQREQHLCASFVTVLEALKNAGDKPVSLAGLRMDIMRLQADLSAVNSAHPLDQLPGLSMILNLVELHSQFVDNLHPFLFKTGGTGQLMFFDNIFAQEFKAARKNPTQYRYLLAFPLVCRSYPSLANPYVAGERENMVTTAASSFNKMCLFIVDVALVLIHNIVTNEKSLSRQMQEYDALPSLSGSSGVTTGSIKGKPQKNEPKAMPGQESMTYENEFVDILRSQHQELGDVCWTLNHEATVKLEQHTFTPREYLAENLVEFFKKTIQKWLAGDALPQPSMLWQDITSIMGSIRYIESSVDIDTSDSLENVLLEQTIIAGVREKGTVAAAYTQFYLELIFKQVRAGGICVSMSQKSFVSLSSALKAHEYTDVTELKALCQLMGPYGVKQLDDMILKQISGLIGEMKSVVGQNKRNLDTIKTKTAVETTCLDALKGLMGLDKFTACATTLGAAMIFRRLLHDALGTVIKSRIPFIYNFVEDIHAFSEGTMFDRLAASTGLRPDVDPGILDALRPHCQSTENDYATFSSMMVMCAASLWSLAYDSGTVFNPSLDAHENNAHAIAIMISQVTAAAFTLTAPSPSEAIPNIKDAQAEFLRIASVNLLRLGNDSSKDSPKARDAVYVILDRLVADSKFVTVDALEDHFPYSLIRTSLHEVYKKVV